MPQPRSNQPTRTSTSAAGVVTRPGDVRPQSLHIRTYPDAVLRARAEEVPTDAASLAALPTIVARMLELMREERGIGLAAPQVGLSWRLFVLDVPPAERRSKPDVGTVAGVQSSTSGPMAFINPRLESSEGSVEASEEGCLSLPQIHGNVLRPPVVTVRALDEQGRAFVLRASGLLARCIQHEYDHVEGVLIIDRMSPMDRLKNRKAIKELEG